MSHAEVAFRYAGRSGLRVERGNVRLGLATTERRTFVDGRVDRADVLGAGLLVVAHVAAFRYDDPAGTSPRLADPFVTTGGDVVRFESLSGCGRVGARLDLLPGGLELTDHAPGMTNVELGQRVRELLGGALPRDPAHLEVGAAGLVLAPGGAVPHERRVALPAGWLHTFAGLPSLLAAMTARAELSARQARTFVRSLAQGPVRGRTREPTGPAVAAALRVRVARDGLRLVAEPGPDCLPLVAPAALCELEPLLRHASGLRLWAHWPTGATWWELDLPHARLGIGLGLDGAADAALARTEPEAAFGLVGYDMHSGWYERRVPVRRDLLEPTRSAGDTPVG